MNNKIKKIIFVSTVAILFILITTICLYRHQDKVKREQMAIFEATIEKQVKEKAINNARAYGYSIEFTEDKTFSMEKDETKFCFQICADGVIFDYCEFPVEEENVNVKEGDVVVCVMNEENDKLNVSYSDSRIVLLDDGTEEPMFSASYFISNKDFDENSLTAPDTLIDGEHKVKKAYDKIMRLTTKEKLKEHYNEAITICNQLNE